MDTPAYLRSACHRLARFTAVMVVAVSGFALVGHFLIGGTNARTGMMLAATFVTGVGLLLLCSKAHLKWQKLIGAGLLSVGVLAFALS